MNNIYVSPNSPTYFEWLTSQVDPFVGRGSHIRFFTILHNTTYVPMMDLDENRAVDGVNLREIYVRNYNLDVSSDLVVDTPCSMLEFLVALASRMNYIYSHTNENCTTQMFWEMMDNIGFGYYTTTDDSFAMNPELENQFEETIDAVIHRVYSADGAGNLFPLKNPKYDQRNVEVWYQMNSYLIEKMGVG